MNNPIIELRAVHVRSGDTVSVPYARRAELKYVDFFALYENLGDGTQEHICDIHEDFEIEPVVKALEKDADVSFLRGVVYALSLVKG